MPPPVAGRSVTQPPEPVAAGLPPLKWSTPHVGFGRGGGPFDGAGRSTALRRSLAKLRHVEVLSGQGTPVADAIRTIGVTEATYYRWRQEFGGLKLDQVRRLKELEAENTRLRKAVADLTLEKLILKEAASGNW
jgi:putative transposase